MKPKSTLARVLAAIALAAGCALLLAAPVFAMRIRGTVLRNVPFVAAFAPLHSKSYPFNGTMRLNFNHNLISGTYTDTSVAAGSPLANRVDVPVSGGIGAGGHLQLNIGGLAIHGHVRGGRLAGSFNLDGRIFVFRAHQGSPGHR